MSNVHIYNVLEKPEALPVMTGSWNCHQKILRTRINRKNIFVGHYTALISIFYWITIYFTSRPVSVRKKRKFDFCVGGIYLSYHHSIENWIFFRMRYMIHMVWLIYDSSIMNHYIKVINFSFSMKKQFCVSKNVIILTPMNSSSNSLSFNMHIVIFCSSRNFKSKIIKKSTFFDFGRI